jgi:sulfite exporter TauE/SafE
MCGSVPASESVLALFLAGLIGGPVHCGAMCGGFVLGQVADRMESVPVGRLCEWRRIGGAALVPYHLGRLTTYAFLGAVVAAGAAALLPHWMGTALLLVGAARFLARGVIGAPRLWGSAVSAMARRAGGNRYLLGVALGFLPCGFLYAALTIAAAGQSAIAGAMGMMAFGLGTVPTLVAVGVVGQVAGRRWQGQVARWAPALMVANAMLLVGLAVR